MTAGRYGVARFWCEISSAGSWPLEPDAFSLLSDADNITAAGNLVKSRLAHRTSREVIFTTIHALRNQGFSCSEIARRTGFPRRSIANWLQFETPPDRRRAALKPTSPWYFEDFLSQSWKDGIRTGSALFRMIQERGYEGSQTHLQRLLAGWRRAEKQRQGGLIGEPHILAPIRDPETGHAISPVIAAALCIKPRGKLTSDQARKVDALKAGSPAFATMCCLAMRFNGILRGREADPLPAWIDDAIETDLAPARRLTHRCHILETGNDSFRFKASSAVAARKKKDTNHALTPA